MKKSFLKLAFLFTLVVSSYSAKADIDLSTDHSGCTCCSGAITVSLYDASSTLIGTYTLGTGSTTRVCITTSLTPSYFTLNDGTCSPPPTFSVSSTFAPCSCACVGCLSSRNITSVFNPTGSLIPCTTGTNQINITIN